MLNDGLYLGDCLEIMKSIDDNSIDCVICDLPYGTTACKWDSVIPFDKLWEQYKRIVKDNGAIVLFGSEPFSSMLRISNLKMYKYDIYWKKEKPTNFFQLKRRIGKCTENLMIFYKKQCTYNPQMVKADKIVKNKPKGKHNSIITGINKEVLPYNDTGYRYPTDIAEFRREVLGTTVHPTQKPIKLLEWLVKTYSNKNDLILDNCMGSGTCGVACKNLNRRFIGIELNEDYFDIAKERISNT